MLPLVVALLSLGAAGSEPDRIVEALSLCAGMTAADVGAGDGEFTTLMARTVGPTGRVYATEVEQDKLDTVRKRAADDGLANVTTVLGDQATTGLPPECCDAILLRMVYHHFTDPPAMRESLRRALKPGGRLAVIEVPPHAGWRHLEGVPERGGHGIPRKDLLSEMRGAGFEVAERHDTWPDEDDSYCVVFRRGAPPAPGRKPAAPPAAPVSH